MGRTKPGNIELPDAAEGQKSHKTLCTITDAEGEQDILRANMPFATPGRASTAPISSVTHGICG